MTLDDTLDAHPESRLWWTTLLATVLPLTGTFAVPLTGDALLACLSAVALVSGGALGRRKKKLASLPLVIAPAVVQDPRDRLWRARVWLGRGRHMQQLVVTFENEHGQHHVQFDGPVVGPWTALASLEHPPTTIHARCTSSQRSWTATAAPQPTCGRFRPPLELQGHSVRWLRENWASVDPVTVDTTV